MKYRKKPVVIEAMQYFSETHATAEDFCDKLAYGKFHIPSNTPSSPFIETLEGNMIVLEGDWIIKGVQGEFYPCKPDIFEATYELVYED